MEAVEALTQAPACCGICHTTPPGRYIDTFEQEYDGGRIYVCTPCVREMADRLGLLDGEVKVVETVRAPTAQEVGEFVLGALRAMADRQAAAPAPVDEGASETCADCGATFPTPQALRAHRLKHRKAAAS